MHSAQRTAKVTDMYVTAENKNGIELHEMHYPGKEFITR
jgi:hypothetical protein